MLLGVACSLERGDKEGEQALSNKDNEWELHRRALKSNSSIFFLKKRNCFIVCVLSFSLPFIFLY